MRISEQSPNGVNGIEHIVGGERAGDAVIEQLVRRRNPARHAVLMAAPHQEQVGRRQHGDGDAGIGQPPRRFGKAPRRRARTAW